jgi:hypothetical protein
MRYFDSDSAIERIGHKIVIETFSKQTQQTISVCLFKIL